MIGLLGFSLAKILDRMYGAVKEFRWSDYPAAVAATADFQALTRCPQIGRSAIRI